MKEQPGFLDKAESVKKLLRVFYAICIGVLLFDLVHHRHVTHPWENLWGFYALFGFIACSVLVLAAKEMRKVVMRKEDYYER